MLAYPGALAPTAAVGWLSDVVLVRLLTINGTECRSARGAVPGGVEFWCHSPSAVGVCYLSPKGANGRAAAAEVCVGAGATRGERSFGCAAPAL